MTLQDIPQHVSRVLYLKVKTADGSQTIGSTSGVVDSRGKVSLQIEWEPPTTQIAYRADYYIDVNENGQYDAPPTDHAWRETFNSSGGLDTTSGGDNEPWTDIAPF